jgi:hypothetical protein
MKHKTKNVKTALTLASTALMFSASIVGADVLFQPKAAIACAERLLCRDYGNAAQSCAVAGDFKQCMAIKLGDDPNYVSQYICNNDGSVKIHEMAQLSSLGIDAAAQVEFNCIAIYADIANAQLFGYRPYAYDSMMEWYTSLDYSTTPLLYKMIINLFDDGK